MDVTKKSTPLILKIISILIIISGIITLIPYKNIDDECFLGYKALCAFTPISTIILIVLGILFWYVGIKATKI